MKGIAARLGLRRSAVARILDDWFAGRGLARPDGRTRRGHLRDKQVAPPAHRALADRVKELADRGKLFEEIAAELGVDRNTVTRSWGYWHESRGLPVPDGRGRRATLDRKSRPSQGPSGP